VIRRLKVEDPAQCLPSVVGVFRAEIRLPSAIFEQYRRNSTGSLFAFIGRMARRARCFVEGLSCHITQRGVNRDRIFRAATDYRVFLTILKYECKRLGLRVHAYALMRNHVHLLATPEHPTSLPRTMQAVGRRYVQFFNRRYARTGGLWEGRYRTALVHDERYWLTCLRYIELNPVRAGIVASPDQYRWSSYLHHAFGKADQLITEHALYAALGSSSDARELAWREISAQQIPPDQVELMRRSIRSGLVVAEPVYREVDAL
jgi:putative transposase